MLVLLLETGLEGPLVLGIGMALGSSEDLLFDSTLTLNLFGCGGLMEDAQSLTRGKGGPLMQLFEKNCV